MDRRIGLIGPMEVDHIVGRGEIEMTQSETVVLGYSGQKR